MINRRDLRPLLPAIDQGGSLTDQTHQRLTNPPEADEHPIQTARFWVVLKGAISIVKASAEKSENCCRSREPHQGLF